MVEARKTRVIGKVSLTSNQIFITLISALLVALLILLSIFANKLNNNYPPVVAFSATGSVSIAPDGIRLNGTANTLTKSSAAGLSEISKVAQSIRQVLAKNNIDKKNISSANLSIYPEYAYGANGNRSLLGYRVSQGFEIVLDDVSKAGAIIDSIINQTGDKFVINSISSFIKDSTAVTKQARENAMKNAKLEAQEYAKLAGKKLGKIISINESSAEPPAMPMATSKEALGTSFDMGSTKIEISLFISWEIK